MTVGFTAGIAAIIFASQLVPLLGLTLERPEPGPILQKLPALWQALPTASPTTIALSLAAVAGLVALKRLRPRWPRMLFVVALASLAAGGSARRRHDRQRLRRHPERFPAAGAAAGGLAKVIEVLPSAFSFALLGAIESRCSRRWWRTG